MKQIEATILGQSYVLACPPGGEQLLQHAVAIVDREMGAIRDAGRVKARERIAVLTALNLAYQRAESLLAPATAAAPPVETQPATAPSADAARPDGDAPAATAALAADAAAIDALIRRIDLALGEDGHLL